MRSLTRSLTVAVCASAAFGFVLPASAADEEPKAKKSETTDATDAKSVSARPPTSPVRVKYTPPKLGKPARSVGGGSRGTADKVPTLYVLVPDHVGQTTSDQPSLYWYIDRAPSASSRLKFTLMDEESVEPRVEAVLPRPTEAGVHRIRLSDHDVRLEPGTEYEWSIALVLDPNERSKDIVVTGWIDRVERSGQLSARLRTEGSDRAAHIYAEEGMWYDALASLSDQIDRNPSEQRLQQARADLLRQVGLDAAVGAGL